ncbi:universal stress protein [Clostridiaceae bacterium HSG29]|nr:universal stress protein [Clostridiaceae bacterium HSG29]
MKNKIMICVTQQKSCENLIREGFELIKDDNDELFVIHVVKKDWRYFSEMKESDALEYLFDVSKQYNAELIIKKSDLIEETLAKFIEDNKITKVVMGESLENEKQQNMINRLKKKNKTPIKWEIIKRK